MKRSNILDIRQWFGESTRNFTEIFKIKRSRARPSLFLGIRQSWMSRLNLSNNLLMTETNRTRILIMLKKI